VDFRLRDRAERREEIEIEAFVGLADVPVLKLNKRRGEDWRSACRAFAGTIFSHCCCADAADRTDARRLPWLDREWVKIGDRWASEIPQMRSALLVGVEQRR
jgi:hypothetical protein